MNDDRFLFEEMQALRATFFKELGTVGMQLHKVQQTLDQLVAIAVDPRPPGTRGPKPGKGKGTIQVLAPGKFRARCQVNMKSVMGPTRKTRKEAEADLLAMKAGAR